MFAANSPTQSERQVIATPIEKKKGVSRLIAARNTRLALSIVTFVAIGLSTFLFVFASPSSVTGPIKLTTMPTKCLDDKWNMLPPARTGNIIWLYDCNGTAAQQWTVRPDGTIHLTDKYCLDVKYAGTKSMNPVWLWPCNGTAAQQWKVNPDESITNPHAPGLCLDDKWALVTKGNPIWMYTCNKTIAQRWTVPKASTANPGPQPTPKPIPVAASAGTSGGSPSPNTPATATGGGNSTPQSSWPDASNTGIPAGTVLTTYTGPCTVTTANMVIDSKTVNCDLSIQASNVIVKNSKINGTIELRTDYAGASQWALTLQDSEVNGGTPQLPAVSNGNLNILRSNIHGAAASVHCDEFSVSCKVQDSWLHGQYMPSGANWHLSAFSLKGGSNVLLHHNTMICDAPGNNVGGCTSDIDLIPDFATISHVLIDDNFIGASIGMGYCAYGGDGLSKPYPHADNVVYQNNIFARGTNGKCGEYGPIVDFNSAGVGNKWVNNVWSDGGVVPPEN